MSSLQLDLETDVGSTTPEACRLTDGVNPLTTGANVVDPTVDGTYTFTLDTSAGRAATDTTDPERPLRRSHGRGLGRHDRVAPDAGDAIGATGATTAQAAAIDLHASPDNQDRVTVQAATSGTGTVDLAQLQGVLRASEITLGPDLGEERPPLAPHLAVNFVGQSPPNTAWLTVYDQNVYGDLTVAADSMDSEINGEQCGGVAALVPTGLSGRAVVARSCDAKSTDTLRLGLLDTSTGVVTALVSKNLSSRIDTYGGTNPPANCDHHQAQLDYHMYCQWVRTTLTITTNPDATVTFTAKSWLRGTGLKNDPSRNDPFSPDLTLIGTTTLDRIAPGRGPDDGEDRARGNRDAGLGAPLPDQPRGRTLNA